MTVRRRSVLKAGVLGLGAIAGCTDDEGSEQFATQEDCTDARVESVEWDYTYFNNEDRDTAIVEVTNFAAVSGDIFVEIQVWGQKDYEDLLDEETRTRFIGGRSTETYELKFYPTEGIEAISASVTQQDCH